jgi:hypothetical protein
MIAAREWIRSSYPADCAMTEPELNAILESVFAMAKPAVAVSIMPHPAALGYLVLVDEDRNMVAALDMTDAVAMGWVVTT